MNTIAEPQYDVASIALTDDFAAMADYVRSFEGHTAISSGLSDIRDGRIIEGGNALATELTRRAAVRRRA